MKLVSRCALVCLLLAACTEEGVLLQGEVLDAYSGEPLAGVVVTVEASGDWAVTDRDGRFELPAEDGTQRLSLEAVGYHPGGRVGARAGSPIEAVMFPLEARDVDITRHMMEMGPTAPPEVRTAPTGEVGSLRLDLVDRPFALPETIRVWRSNGTPLQPSSPSWTDESCNPAAVVEVLPLEEYVKGVIPHEWSPSWHPQALQAGAVAARSYALGHALAGGRWDCADVDDGTVTQVYRDDRAGPTNDAVEATRGQVVLRDGAIVRAEYSAENGDPTAHDVDDPTCTGTTLFGHGRGMCQWGTQRWALGICANEPCDFGSFGAEPKDYEWMVEHYYPGAEVAGSAADVVPCGVLPPEGGVIDDADACASVFGPSEYWRSESGGYNGGLLWTNAFVTSVPSNWGRFRIHVTEAGRYSLEVYVEPGFGGHEEINYTLEDADGSASIVFNQRVASGWTYLRDLRLESQGSVSVYDTADAVDDADRRVVFDAIRLTRLDGTPTDAGPPGGSDGGIAPGTDAGLDGPGRDMANGCGCTISTRGPAPLTTAMLAMLAILVVRRRRA